MAVSGKHANWHRTGIGAILILSQLSTFAQSPSNRCSDAEYAVQQMVIGYQPGQKPDISTLNRWYQSCANPGAMLLADYYLLRAAWYIYDQQFSVTTALEEGSAQFDASQAYWDQRPLTRGQNPEGESAFLRLTRQLQVELENLNKQAPVYQTSYRQANQPGEEAWVKNTNGSPAVYRGETDEPYRGPVAFEKKDLFSKETAPAQTSYEYNASGISEPYGFVGVLDSLSLMHFFQWVNRPRPDEEVLAYQPTSQSRGMTPAATASDIPTWAVTTTGIGLSDTTFVLSEPKKNGALMGYLPWGARVELLGERRFEPEGQTFFEKVKLDNGQQAWIMAGSVAEEDRIGVLIREMPLFEVGPDQQTYLVRMLPAGSLLAVSDRQGEWIRVDDPSAKASGWIADPSVLSLSSADREIALRLHQAVLESNQYLQTSQLLQISQLPGFYDSALAPVILAQIEQNSRS